MTLMQRRRALMGVKKGSAQRLYIFKDGVYQSWLNGAEFQIGGYKTNSQGEYGPSSSVSVNNDEIVFQLQGAHNRRNSVCIGLDISGLTGNQIKKAGGYFSCNNYVSNENRTEEIGFSELFITSAYKTTALGESETFHIAAAGDMEVDSTIQTPNYLIFLLRMNGITPINGSITPLPLTIYIREVWVEV